MTSTETAAPRKRAPRKAAAAADDPKAGGVDARKAQQIREQLEAATGEQVTAPAARRVRGGVTGYKVIRPEGEQTPNERRAAAAQHAGDPGPVEPGIEEDPDAVAELPATPPGGDEVAEAACPDCGGPCDLTHAGAVDPSPTPPPAELPAAADPERPAAAGAESPAAAPAPELPAGVIACGPGDVIPGDAAAIAAFAGELERRATAGLKPCPAANGAACSLLDGAPGCCRTGDQVPAELAGALQHLADTFTGRVAADEARDVDVRSLVAHLDVAVPFDFATLIAGRVDTAPDGSRVTVLDWPGVDNAPGPVDTAPGVQLPGEPAPPPPAAPVDVEPVRLSDADAAAIEEARELEARAGELLEAAKAIKSRVQEAMGGEKTLATVAIDGNGVKLADWTRYTETRLDGTALKKAHPDVWSKFAKTSQRRRFTWAD